VLELEAGANAAAIWQEVNLLRLCTHRRIVPLFGVAIQASSADATWI